MKLKSKWRIIGNAHTAADQINRRRKENPRFRGSIILNFEELMLRYNPQTALLFFFFGLHFFTGNTAD